MIRIRAITLSDTEDFIKLAFEAGIGMTSMPKNRDLLAQRVKDSVLSFQDPQFALKKGSYLFVLEDLKKKYIAGTCGIIPRTGRSSPLLFYKLKHLEQRTDIGFPPQLTSLLHIIQHRNYWSEIGSLYLNKQYRKGGLGRLLSLSRFLFIAAFPERFDAKIFAEMRGHVDENKNCPFWEGIGRHFIDTEFETLMNLRNEGDVDLSKAVPIHPLYLNLLPKPIQESIGKTHAETIPALKILFQEGFKLSDEFDICDGGPKIEAHTQDIRTVKDSFLQKFSIVPFEANDKESDSPLFLISNNQLAFKACLSPLKKKNAHAVMIPEITAEILQLLPEDEIRYVALQANSLK